MAHKSNARTEKSRANRPDFASEERLRRHEEFMKQQQAKGLLHPEEEWEERVNRGLKALFGPAPTRRRL